MDYTVTVRKPLPPHTVLAQFPYDQANYGLLLMRPQTADVRIPRAVADVQALPSPRVGLMATVERGDGLLPFVGYVTRYAATRSAADVELIITDHTWLIAQALTQKGGTFSGASGTLIAQTLREIDARGQPPLGLLLDRVVTGPGIDYAYAAAKGDQFLKSVVDFTGWEWQIAYAVTRGDLTASLIWQERIGDDLRGSTVWEEGKQLQDVSYVQDAAGYLAAGVAIGGTGAVSERPAAAVNAAGVSSASIAARVATVNAGVSPALQGTRLVMDPAITSSAALFAAAARATLAPDNVAEAISFKIVESETDMSAVAVGNIVTVRLASTDLGLPLQRDVRILAIGIDGAAGVHSIEAQVL